MECERQGEVLFGRQLIEHDGAIADQTELIQRTNPGFHISNGVGPFTEYGDRSRVREYRAREQVDQYFGHRLVETEQRDRLACVQIELLHPQRTQTPVVLDCVVDFDERAVHVSDAGVTRRGS